MTWVTELDYRSESPTGSTLSPSTRHRCPQIWHQLAPFFLLLHLAHACFLTHPPSFSSPSTTGRLEGRETSRSRMSFSEEEVAGEEPAARESTAVRSICWRARNACPGAGISPGLTTSPPPRPFPPLDPPLPLLLIPPSADSPAACEAPSRFHAHVTVLGKSSRLNTARDWSVIKLKCSRRVR